MSGGVESGKMQDAPLRPNILLIITHDTGREIGPYGAGVETPNLDRLAAEGVCFTNAFCSAPQCSPSRASLLTGLIPTRHGLIGLTHRGFCLRPDAVTLPQTFAAAGYETHLFGLQHESPDPKWLGYNHVHRARSNSCRDVTPLVVDFLRNGTDKPFLAVVGFSETHRPFPEANEPLAADRPVPGFLPDAPEVRRDLADLYEAVRRVDESVGQIAEALESSCLAQSTLLMYTTDHGIAFPGAKGTLFDPGVGISLIARGPEPFQGGRKVSALVSNVDIMPTLLEWAGVTPPPGLDGHSLLPVLTGAADEVRDALWLELTYHAAYDPMRGLRTRRYKYIRSFEPSPWWLPPNVDEGYTKNWYRVNEPGVYTRPRPEEFLFDLHADPFEQNNLASDPGCQEILEHFRSILQERMEAFGDPLLNGPIPLPAGARTTPRDAWHPSGDDTGK